LLPLLLLSRLLLLAFRAPDLLPARALPCPLPLLADYSASDAAPAAKPEPEPSVADVPGTAKDLPFKVRGALGRVEREEEMERETIYKTALTASIRFAHSLTPFPPCLSSSHLTSLLHTSPRSPHSQVFAVADFLRYQCDSKPVLFKATSMFQTRTFSFPVTNTSTASMDFKFTVMSAGRFSQRRRISRDVGRALRNPDL
jgi:hypothetical protein